MRVAGIDGTKGGWVVIVLEDGTFSSDRLIRRIDGDFGELGDVAILAIDVPIGFGPREADGAARGFLTGAASTVFATPPRRLLETAFALPPFLIRLRSSADGRSRSGTEPLTPKARIREHGPDGV